MYWIWEKCFKIVDSAIKTKNHNSDVVVDVFRMFNPLLEEKVAKAEKKVEKFGEHINELRDYQVDPERLKVKERRIVDLEDRSREITSVSME